MKLVRTMVAGFAVCALGLTACGSGTTVGGGLDTSISARPSESTKKASPTKKPSKKPATSPKTTATKPTRKIGEHVVVAQTGYQYEPLDVFARVGDNLTFKNEAEDSNHSFTIETGEYDSGVVKMGDEVKFTIDMEPGTYNFACSVVPYMVGGRLTVA